MVGGRVQLELGFEPGFLESMNLVSLPLGRHACPSSLLVPQ